jgi:phosphatidate cytidylyltransferase
MSFLNDRDSLLLAGGVLGILVVATAIGQWLRRWIPSGATSPTIENLNARIAAWWLMCAVFGAALLLGKTGMVILFAFISFWALREFITLTPTRRGDHRALFWVFFVITPFQYWLVWREWYGLFSIMIPVYAFLFIPIRSAIEGDCERFLERTAKIQWGLMVCVYCVSHAAYLLVLPIRGHTGLNGKLLFFLVLVVQLSDVLQYVFGKCAGRTPVAPKVSPGKTVEGTIGGILSATLVGTCLWRLTPFEPWQAAAMSLVIGLMGFAGGLTMSAIKRDRGVKDYGNLIEGHGGMLDRVDSLCFAAPVFFHLTRFYFS